MKCSLFVGDVHGDLNQLLYPLFEFLDNMDKYERIVFLGDYVDRGESNAYIYLILNFFINEPQFKDQIIFLCGNHDVWPGGSDSHVAAEGFSPYIKSIHQLRGWGQTTKSFIFKNLSKLPFRLAYYNKEWNILFTHSQQVKEYGPWNKEAKKTKLEICSLDENLAKTTLNVGDENNVKLFKYYTWFDWSDYFDWYETERKERTYKNICGHCHCFDSDALTELFNNEVSVASIDSDSSYFFRPLIGTTHFFNNLEPSWESFVRYISIPGDDGKSWSDHQLPIKFYNDKSHINYNLSTFEELKNEIASHLTNPAIRQNFINNFQLQPLIDIFEKRFKEEFNKEYVEKNVIKDYESKYKEGVGEIDGYSIVYPIQEIEFDDKNEIKLTEYNIKRCIKYRHDFDNKQSNVYFNDVPIDVYHHYGIFKNEKVNDIGKLYCMIVWGNLWYKAWLKQFNHEIIKDKVFNDCCAVHSTENEEPKLDGAFMRNKLLLQLFIKWLSISLIILVIILLIISFQHNSQHMLFKQH